jgi:subtilisin family serine protease
MATTTRRLAAVCTAVAAISFWAPQANAAFHSYKIAGGTTIATPFVSPPPKLDRQVHWYRWHTSRRMLQARAPEFADSSSFGSTAVIGLESNRDLQALRTEYGLDDVEAIPQLHAALARVDRADLETLLSAAPNDERIRYVSPVGPTRQLLRLRNDPLVRTVNPAIRAPYEWQFFSSRVDLALNISKGDPRILACTIDTGVADVPDLAGKVAARLYLAGMGDGVDVQGHGTAVASLIVANADDGFGMAGFGGATRLISLRDEALSDTSIAVDIVRLTSLGCRIINLSFGGPDPISGILRDAIEKAVAAGVLLVAAAGNDEGGPVSHPAADLQPAGGAPSVGLAVGASDVTGKTSPFSNRGDNLSLLAPGDYDYGCSGVLVAISTPAKMFDGSCYPIWGAAGGARYAYVGGTSFSSPEVAGVAALVWAARPELHSFQVADIIKRSAHRDTPGWTPTAGYGVLDAAAALELATGRSSADALSITGFRTARSAERATATGKVTWSDGIAASEAAVTCAASGLRAEVTFSEGTFTCRWRIPKALRRKTLPGLVTARNSETALSVTQAFTLGHPRVP